MERANQKGTSAGLRQHRLTQPAGGRDQVDYAKRDRRGARRWWAHWVGHCDDARRTKRSQQERADHRNRGIRLGPLSRRGIVAGLSDTHLPPATPGRQSAVGDTTGDASNEGAKDDLGTG